MSRILTILLTYIQVKYFHRFKDRQRLESWQQKQLLRHLRFLQKHSPFYRQRIRSMNLSELPIMEKSSMMAHFNELNTLGLKKEAAFELALGAESSRDFSSTLNGVTIGLSSGTSGNRGLFAVSPSEQALWAGQILAKALPGSLFKGKHRVALFLRANSNLYESTGSSKVQFQFYDLLKALDEQLLQLNSFQPNVLVSPPSMLRMLAERQNQGRLSIAPQRIYSAAEVLEPQDAAFIAAAFKTPTLQIYQATEGFLAISCEANSLHLNEDIVLVEKEFIAGDKERFVPIITDFRRRTQPIVRYRLNDILTLDPQACSCGSAFIRLKSIDGRSDDLIRFASLDPAIGTRDVFPDFLRRAVISSSDRIREYRIRQKAIDLLLVELKLEEGEDEAGIQTMIRANISELCQTLGVRPPQLQFHPYTFQAGMIKLRRIMNEIPKL